MLDRTIAPQINEVDVVHFVNPKTIKLAEHVSLFWINDVPNATARLDFYFDAGTIRSKSLVASLTAGMIFSGTNEKDATTFHNLLDDRGAYYDVSVSQENAIVSFYGLTDQILQIFRIFEEAMNNVVFPDSEFNEIITERKQKLLVSLQKVNILAQREFQSKLFNQTVYGRFTEIEDFDSISKSDIIDFFEQFYRNGLTKIVAVGDLKSTDVDFIVGQSKRWCVKQKPIFAASFSTQKSESHLEKKDALQTALRIGKILFNKQHEDYISFIILNTFLGDYFGSRLMKNIREDKGYTYGIGSYLSELQNTGYFIIATEVGKDFIQKTIDEVKKEIEILQSELITNEEMDLVRSYLLGQVLKSADGPYATMDLFLAVEQHGLDLEFYNKYIQKIRDIQAEELREIARKYLNWDSLSIITAG
jgi:predicted Zn-dependent peptidase